MKRTLFHIIIFVALIPINLSFGKTPPPPGSDINPKDHEQVERAILNSISAQREPVLAYLIYDVQVSNIKLSKDQAWASAWLNPVDLETGQIVPAEPGLALAMREGKDWRVILPSDPGWVAAVKAAPSNLLSSEIKSTWLELYGDDKMSLDAGPFGGYLLPWAGGETMYMTQSVHHDKYTASLSAHYAFDFAAPWDSSSSSPMFNVYAAKAGTVKRAVWEHEDHNEKYGNYLVLEDTATTPTSYQLYLHLSQNSIPSALRVIGAPVIQGQFIGVADDTGISSGNHLHFHVHLNADKWWDRSVDITFDDVTINGGRPRNAIDLKYCLNNELYQDVCDETSKTYVSGNTVHSDLTSLQGDILDPLNGITVYTDTIRLAGWATDDDSTLSDAQFIAKSNGTWRDIGRVFTTTRFSMDWNLCNDAVPDGPISLALKLRDTSGNQTHDLPGLRHFTKNFTCPPPPPACVPGENQAALFATSDYGGACALFEVGTYTNTSALGDLGEDNAASIQVGNNIQVTLYINENNRGRGETFVNSDRNLSDNLVGADTVSSLLVQPQDTSPSVPIPFWPTSTVTYTAGTSLSLVWDNAGGATQYQARIRTNVTQTLTSPWQSDPVWHLGSLVVGSHTWQVKAANSYSESSWSEPYTLTIQSLTLNPSPTISVTAPYTDAMENDDNGWINSRYWDQTRDENHTTGGYISWMYDVNVPNSYDTGSPNTGDLTSPPIFIPSNTFYLRFWYLYETESPGRRWDQRWVQISVDGGPFTNTLQLYDDPPNTWLQSPVISLSDYLSSTIQVRFHFETLDETFNNYRGWFIDDFAITTTPPPTCSNTPEPNDTPSQAVTITYTNVITAQICPGGDLDFFKFNGTVGDRVGLAVDAKTSLPASKLDSYLFLLDEDGESILAENDDQILYQRTDSLLSYTLPRSGVYYVKVRAWNHPSVGGSDYLYNLTLIQDDVDPSAAFIYPTSNNFLPDAPITLTITANDATSGISHVELLWHSGDWLSSDWELIGDDWNAQDGWSYPFDMTTISNQTGIAFYARAFDWAGNWIGTGIWNLSKTSVFVYLPLILIDNQ